MNLSPNLSSAPFPTPGPGTILGGRSIPTERLKTTFAVEQSSAKGLNNGHQRESASMTLDDPVAQHMLVETALSDSKAFHVLNYDELDALKKEDHLLVTRIEGLRHKLALETKVRDAARSMNRLHMHGGYSNGAIAGNNAAELEESERKCDELGREIYALEQRLWFEVQMKLMQHTAGVLAKTYGEGHRPRVEFYGLPGGRPMSPVSDGMKSNGMMNGSSNYNKGRERNWDKVFEYDDDYDDGNIDADGGQMADEAQIKQQKDAQMAIGRKLEELNDFVREILGRVNSSSPIAQISSPKLPTDPNAVDTGIFEQLNSLTRGLDEIKEEQRALKLDRQLKNTATTPKTPKMDLRQKEQQEMMLERELREADSNMTNMLVELNQKFVDVVAQSPSKERAPPLPRADLGSGAQIKYAQDRLASIVKMTRGMSASAQRAQHGNGNAQHEAMLHTIWQSIKSSEIDARRRNMQTRELLAQRRRAGEDVDDEEAELMPDQDTQPVDGEVEEEFSMSAFATKVNWIVSKSTYLREKHSDLQRRMRQLRQGLEDRERARREEVAALTEQIERLDDAAEEAREELRRAQMRIDEQSSAMDTHAKSGKQLVDLQDQVRRRDADADHMRAQLEETKRNHTDVKDKLFIAEQSVQKWQSDHSEAIRSLEASQAQRRDVMAQHQKTKTDMAGMESDLARLTTELTMAKADLDALQGSSRNERAAAEKSGREEAETRMKKLLAATEDRERKLKTEMESYRSQHARAQDQLAAQAKAVQRSQGDDAGGKARELELRRELEATLKDFEDLTRASVEAEKEREELEKVIDNLRDRVESLESQVSEDRIAKLGSSTNGGSGSTASGNVRNSDGSERAARAGDGGSTSALVLKNEFKKMMREARSEHQKALRVEQEERRKLESQLRSLKRGTVASTGSKSTAGIGK